MRIGKSIEVKGKQFATWLLAKVLGDQNRELDPPKLSDLRSVLFVRPNFRMGNMLLATPAFHAARECLPDARISLLTTSAYVHMLHGHPDLDRVHILTRKMIWNLWALFSLVKEIRAARYDLVVDCSEGESLLGASFIGFSKAPYRLGMKGSKQEAFFNLSIPVRPTSTHRIDKLLDLMDGIGIRSENRSMKLSLARDDLDWAEQLWSSWNIKPGRLSVGINIGARGDKRWPIKHFLQLVEELIRMDVTPIIFAGPQELDRLAEMDGKMPEEVIIDTTNVPGRFAALLSRCSVFVTGDTGPMHLAAAIGTPTIAIFIRNNFQAYCPQGEKHRTLYSETGVTFEEVLSAINQLTESEYLLKTEVIVSGDHLN